MARRRKAPDDGPEAVRRAELTGDLRAERRLAEQSDGSARARAQALAGVREGAERDLALIGDAEAAVAALSSAAEAVAGRRDALQSCSTPARRREETAAALKACAQEEAGAPGPAQARQRGRDACGGRRPAGA